MKNRDITKRIIDIVEYQFDERYITIGYLMGIIEQLMYKSDDNVLLVKNNLENLENIFKAGV